jgi:hypothetical protein
MARIHGRLYESETLEIGSPITTGAAGRPQWLDHAIAAFPSSQQFRGEASELSCRSQRIGRFGVALIRHMSNLDEKPELSR